MVHQSSPAFTNKLINESSPYLLQHAHNPVNWYPWGREALEKAKKEDKPILVSIGYAACHWCHVMEKESFEDTIVADYMNEHFVCIKVDREERPDLDNIYMEAVQAIAGSGGWPMNVFLTPETKPFYGGTYSPPKSLYNRPSWMETLKSMAKAYKEEREKVEIQAKKLTDYIEKNGNTLLQNTLNIDKASLSDTDFKAIFNNMKSRFDERYGGFGSAPKFPNTMNIRFLLNYNYFYGEESALKHAILSMNEMIKGGIYDQVGGGFARYSTDAKWLVPHFEKMLYDNALLVELMADMYKIKQDDLYKNAIEQTLQFIKDEMTNEESGFYSSYDADSEGEEGKFYVWDKKEIDEILGDESEVFCNYYDVTTKGNWEHKNILNIKTDIEIFSEKNNIDQTELQAQLKRSVDKLLQNRSKRVKPDLDDKIILAWNAMMCSAYINAYKAIQHNEYKIIAENNMQFMLEAFKADSKEPSKLNHTYKNKQSKYLAFIDDYAYLINALIDLYEITYKEEYLEKARTLSEYAIEKYFDKQTGLFYYNSSEQGDILVRKKETYDGALPSGNSSMVKALQRLGLIIDNKSYINIAENMNLSLLESIKAYPTSFGRWANNLILMHKGFNELVIIGQEAFNGAQIVNSNYYPNNVLMVKELQTSSEFPLIHNKSGGKRTKYYLCKNYSCKLPVENVKDFISLLNNSRKK